MSKIEQNALTVVADVKPGQQSALTDVLTLLGKNPDNSTELPCFKVEVLHFACFVILNADGSNPPCLVFESNFDGGVDAYLNQLTAVGRAGLISIFGLCMGFPENPTDAQIREYITQHSIPNAAFYIAFHGQSVGAIRNAISVRENIEAFLDVQQAAGALNGLSAQKIVQRIQAHLSSPEGITPQVSQTTIAEQAELSKSNTIKLILVALPLVLLFLPFIIVWMLLLRWREYRDNHKDLAPLPIDPRLFKNPDIHTQSHLTTMVTVRDGWVRALTLKFVLAVTSLLAKKVAIAGNLLGIPTIHFARWAMMNNGKRMIFFSNYDGSWSSYLGDFVDKAKYGLTAIWGNTDRFPPSKWLAFGGAAQMTPFKQWSHEHNVFSPFFYRAYPSATVANLLNDFDIRDSVGMPMSEAEAAKFLQKL